MRQVQSRCHFKEIETSLAVAVTACRVAEAIIPLAQLPWDEPSREERNVAANQRNVELALLVFVRRRNAVIQPKSVDLRIAVILGILDSSASTSDVKAKEITAALDALDGAK